jgi:hypothetical protein
VVEYFDQPGRRQTSCRATDRRVAERIAQKLEADVAVRREGAVDTWQGRVSEKDKRPRTQHVCEHIQHCQNHALAPMGIVDRDRYLNWIT